MFYYENTLKLIIFLSILAALLVYNVYQHLRVHTPSQSDRLITSSLKHYMLDTICSEYCVPFEKLDPNTVERIEGAASKSLRPIKKDQSVQIRLPRLQLVYGICKDFEVTISMKDLRPWIQRLNNQT